MLARRNSLPYSIKTFQLTTHLSTVGSRAGLKCRGDPGQFLLEGPYDVIHDVIVCESYVFAD